MDVLILLVFVSFVLVIGGVLLLAFGLAQGDFEHAERLSLLPLADDAPSSTERTPSPSSQRIPLS
jgi:hypothetical protein